MGYIPKDAEWYIAELVEEITVEGASRNVIHRNTILINARSPEEAYAKANANGLEGETAYLNPKNQSVKIRFRGISRLDVIYDALEDGAELWFEAQLGISEEEILKTIPAKENLEVFTAPKPREDRDPDYASKDVVEEAIRMIDRTGKNETRSE